MSWSRPWALTSRSCGTCGSRAVDQYPKAVLEGVFYFPLPQDASISGFGMWIGDQLVEADVVEKQRAREIYETGSGAVRLRGGLVVVPALELVIRDRLDDGVHVRVLVAAELAALALERACPVGSEPR